MILIFNFEFAFGFDFYFWLRHLSKEQQLWDASTVGDLPLVTLLTSDPSLNLNWGDPERNRTPFYRSCFYGHLLNHPKTDVIKSHTLKATPFFAACQEGHVAVVLILISARTAEGIWGWGC